MTKRLEEICDELHTIANSYAGEKNGTEASLIHMSISFILKAMEAIEKEKSVNEYEIYNIAAKWASSISFLREFEN